MGEPASEFHQRAKCSPSPLGSRTSAKERAGVRSERANGYKILTILSLLISTLAINAETLVLKNATVHTVTGETISPGNVVVTDGKITAVSKNASASGAKVIDLTGLHLYPGLILPATSLGLTEINAVRATQDTTEVGSFTPDVKAWLSVNPDSELLPVARANGITHFNVVPMGGVIPGYSGVMQMSGWTIESMAIRTPAALHLYWPNMGLNAGPKEFASDRSKWKSPEDQAKERDKKLKEIDDFFDDAEAYRKARSLADKSKAPLPVPAWEAMLPMLEGKAPIFVHADETRQIKAAVAWAEKRKYSIVIEGGRDAWRVADTLAKQKIPVIYDRLNDQPPSDTDTYEVQFKAPAVLQKARVKVLFNEGMGSFPATGARNLPHDAGTAIAYGLPADEALKGVTLYPAQVLGVADKLGSIEVGKEASLIACNGPILDIRTEVKHMWIKGSEVSLESRHTKLYEKYKSRPKP
jgi:imidazolonepropionase-like amidohydrolase